MYIYLIHVSLRLPPTTTTAAQLAAFTFVPSCSFFCLFCFSLVSPFLSPRSPYPTQPYPLLLLFLSSGAPSIRLSRAASGRLPATIFHRQPAKQLTAQPPPGNCFGCERNFKHRHTASLGPPKHCFPLSLSLVSLLPISLHTSLCLSLSLSVFLSFSPSLCSSLYTYSLLFSLFPPPSLCFSVFPPLPDCLSTHSHIRTAMRIVFLICLLSIFAVPFSFWVFLPPSFPSSTTHSLHTLFSPFPSFHSSIPPPLYDPQGNKVW